MEAHRFVIPGSFTFEQSITLLYSIISNQYQNVATQVDNANRSSPVDLAECQRLHDALDNLIRYYDDGLTTIETQYNVPKDGLINNRDKYPEIIQTLEDMHVLIQDIRVSRRTLSAELRKHNKFDAVAPISRSSSKSSQKPSGVIAKLLRRNTRNSIKPNKIPSSKISPKNANEYNTLAAKDHEDIQDKWAETEAERIRLNRKFEEEKRAMQERFEAMETLSKKEDIVELQVRTQVEMELAQKMQEELRKQQEREAELERARERERAEEIARIKQRERDLEDERRRAKELQIREDMEKAKREQEEREMQEEMERKRIALENQEREKLKLEREALEKARIAENERREKARLEKDRLEKERLERQRLDNERLSKERADKERHTKEKAEKEANVIRSRYNHQLKRSSVVSNSISPISQRHSFEVANSAKKHAEPKSRTRKSMDLTNIGKAAQSAWTQYNPNIVQSHAKKSVKSSPPETGKQKPVVITKKRYEYVKPTVNRRPIKASIKASPPPIVLPPKRYSTSKVTSPVDSSKQGDARTLTKPSKNYPSSAPTSPINHNDVAKPPFILDATTDTKHTTSSPIKGQEERIQTIMDSLHGVDPKACEQILSDILVMDEKIFWDDIAGLKNAKNSLKETVVYPFLRPDLFKGLREPVRGMLLFGPPGTGKTMIANAVATESNSTFFSISASSLLSKYLGESEKLVKALFYIAKRMAPSIIFIDEIDSLLTARSDNENESSRRIKTELLIQWSSLSNSTAQESASDNRVLVLAATNLPWAIDDAARRRFSRRLFIPLPEYETRLYHIKKLMSSQKNQLTEEDFETIANATEGFSGSDLTALAKEAAMEPIRELGDNLMIADNEKIREVQLEDFKNSLQNIKKSVSPQSIAQYEHWASEFGSTGA